MTNAKEAPKVVSRRPYAVQDTSIWVEVRSSSSHVHEIKIDAPCGALASKGVFEPECKMGLHVEKRLAGYFNGTDRLAGLALWSHPDSFNQQAAMAFLRSIPLGQQRSYSEQAKAVRKRCGNKFNARNAGNANRNNHYPLAIPCHRVVRKDGDVGGFMGSTKSRARTLKQALLEHEARWPKT